MSAGPAPRLTDVIREDAALVSDIIRRSFADVATRFGLTSDNAPTHPSNCEPSWVERGLDRGDHYIVVTVDDGAVGCVALRTGPDRPLEMRRLAVLPEHRRRGYGRLLVEAANERARAMGAEVVEIGVIADHVELVDWYGRLGWIETRRARYDSLPFEVLHMRYTL